MLMIFIYIFFFNSNLKYFNITFTYYLRKKYYEIIIHLSVPVKKYIFNML